MTCHTPTYESEDYNYQCIRCLSQLHGYLSPEFVVKSFEIGQGDIDARVNSRDDYSIPALTGDNVYALEHEEENDGKQR